MIVFAVTVIILVGLLILAVNWPWPDVAREPAGQPWVPWDRNYDLGMTPEDWDALETLIDDPRSLAEAAEQEARQSVNGCYIPLTDEGNTNDHEH